MQGLAGGNLVGRNEPALGHQLFEPGNPNLVIRLGEIFGWVEALPGGASLVDVPASRGGHRHGEGKGAPLPRRMEDGLVVLGDDRAEAHHAAHILCAVHASSAGDLASPVPIMLSRVTRLASCCSLQPSAPAGCSGRTRSRISAVESQTLMCLSGGRLRPKSANTERGSSTARER